MGVMQNFRSRKAGLAIAAAAVLLLASCDSAEDRLAKHVAKGQELLEDGERQKAAIEFRNALSLDGANVAAHLGLASIYEASSNFPAMIAHLNKVLETEPANTLGLVKTGQVQMLSGRLDEALTSANNALAAAPADVGALVLKAGVSLRLENDAAAVELANQAIALDPDNPTAHAVLIGERVRAGDSARALEIADDITRRVPGDLGLALVKLQVTEEAGDQEALLSYLIEIADRFSDQATLREALARLYLQRGETGLAEVELRKLAEAAPNDPQPALRVVQFINSTSGPDAARAELETLVAARSDPTPFIVALAEFEFAAGDRAGAQSRLEALIGTIGEDADKANEVRITLSRQHLRAKDRESALALVQTVLQSDAANVEGLAIRAAIRYDEGDYNAALLDIRAALASAPNNPQLLLLSARTNMRAGNPDLAGENFANAARLSEYAPELTMEYVNYLRLRQRQDAILTVLREAARRQPQSEIILRELAAAQLGAGDWVGADETASRLAELDRTASDQVRAASLSGRERYDESLAVLSELAERGEGGDGPLASIVQVYARAGRLEEARAFLDSVVADNPGNSRALVLRGFLSANDGAPDAAEADFRAAVEIDPGDAASHLALARLYYGTGRQGEAVALAKEAVETVRDAGTLRLFLGGVHESRQDFDAAIDTYRAMFEAAPGSLLAANNLASLLTEHKSDDPEAIAEAARIAVVLRNVTIPAFQDTYGWIQHLQGSHETALRYLLPAVDGLPENPYVRYHVGAVYAALGDVAAARTHLQEAVKADVAAFSRLEAARELLESLPAE